MRQFPRSILVKWLFIPPVAVGLLVLFLVVRRRAEPERADEQEVARVLRVVEAPEVEIVPRALGYGTTEPGRVWQAVAEVKGRVIEVNPDLEPGAVLNAGAVVLKIDPIEYELAIARLVAEIAQAQAQLEELNAKKVNDEASLSIEQDSLTLAENELSRLRQLLERNAASDSAVEQQQRAVLAQRQIAQSLQSALNLFPSQAKALEANITVRQEQLEQARIDLQKTQIKAPFDCRVGPVAIEVGQFLAAGQALFESHSVDFIEVEAQVAPRDVRNLMQQPADRVIASLDMETMRDIFQLDAFVRFGDDDVQVEWPARFLRVRENLDPETRTVGIVFAIDDPYRQATPSTRPPPIPGTFCEIELRAQKRVRAVVVPRIAVQNGHAYVVNAASRLERRAVQVAFAQSGFVAIADGLRQGDVVVVSDPTPAIEEMLIEPVSDSELRQRLISAASGEGSVR